MEFIYDKYSFDEPVWVAFWGMYMYGPYPTLEEVLYEIYNHYEDERNIVG